MNGFTFRAAKRLLRPLLPGAMIGMSDNEGMGKKKLNYLDQLDQMLDAEFRIISMETYDVSRVQELFVQITRFSNKAFYSWEPGRGMHRIGAAHITIPRTQTLEDVLTHVLNSKHFGVYIINGLTDELEDKKIQDQLLELVNSEVPKVVVLLGEFIDLPKCLKPHTLRSKHQMRKAG